MWFISSKWVLLLLASLSDFLFSLWQAGMFNIAYRGTELCFCKIGESDSDNCDIYDDAANFCGVSDSLQTVYYMFLSLIEPDRIMGSAGGEVLFNLFMFIVVILLANVLIAIVTDSFRDIQLSHATRVYWCDRFDFIAEVEGIKAMLQSVCPTVFGEKSVLFAGSHFGERWKFCTLLFSKNTTKWSPEFMTFWNLHELNRQQFRRKLAFYRLFYGFVIIMWVIAGVISAGLLWPPQLREFLMAQKIKSSTGEIKNEEERVNVKVVEGMKNMRIQMLDMADDIKDVRATVTREVKQSHDKITSEMEKLRNEMQEIKEILLSLKNS